MPAAESRKPEGLVGLPVLVRSDSNQRGFEQPDDGRHDLVAVESFLRDVGLDALSDLPQHIAQLEHPLELGTVAVLAKMWVVTILLAAAAIAGSHLKVSVFMRANPHVGPRRGNYQRLESMQGFARPDHDAVGAHVREAAAVAVAANSRHRIGDVPETRRCGGPHVFVRDRLAQLSSSNSRAQCSRLMPRDGEAGRPIWTRRGRGGNLFLRPGPLDRSYGHPRLGVDPDLERHARRSPQ